MTASPHVHRRAFWGWVLGLLALAVLAVAGSAAHTVVLQSDPPRAGALFGAGTYKPGELVQLSALPARGFEFEGWFEGGESVSSSPFFAFTADRNRTLVAKFRPVLDFVGLSGSGQGSLTLLPTPGLGANRFELRPRFQYGSDPWDLRFVTAFVGEEWRDFQAHFTGSWAGLRFGGGILFNPLVPAYRSAYGMVSGSWDDLRLGLRVTHYPLSGTPPAPYLLYVLTLSTSTLSATVRAEERGGLTFKDALVNVFSLGLCCEIEAQATLSFTKEGFAYFRGGLINLPFPCCGMAFDASITYTADSKVVEFAPRWEPLCDVCLTVYGDVLWDRDTFTWNGLALYGYKIRCCFGSACCPAGAGGYIEFLTALDPSRVPGGFQGEEFEYIRVGACGPGCCGGQYTFEATAYFSPTGLFGLSRFKIGGGVPLGGGWVLSPSLEVSSSGTSLSVGWQLRF